MKLQLPFSLACCARGSLSVILPLVVSTSSSIVLAQPTPFARDIVERVEHRLWGSTLQAVFEMTVTTPSWTRSLVMNVTMERPAKSFLRVTAPAKDAGILSLRLGSDMWSYIPAIERTLLIPPTMRLQPWLGSDFTYDDMVREASYANDYTHRLVSERAEGEMMVYDLELLPKAESAVVWGKVLLTVDRTELLPLQVKFFNERGDLVRTLRYSERRLMGGRMIPTQWEMRPEAQPGKQTTIVVRSAVYDKVIPTGTFTLQNLGQRR